MEKITAVPKHLGIIMDGNRRYAEKQGLKGYEGHAYGREVFYKCLEWAQEFGIKKLTIYTFSSENFTRTKKEVSVMMELFRKGLMDMKHDKRLDRNKIKVNFVGQLWKFPEDIQQLMYEFMDETKKHHHLEINFAMGYGGRSELVELMQNLAEDVKNGLDPKQITEKFVQERLYLKEDIDMVIRTGGVVRTSNFFPWQTVYAEWFFLQKLWPEFTKRDFYNCLVEYGKRERRMGK